MAGASAVRRPILPPTRGMLRLRITLASQRDDDDEKKREREVGLGPIEEGESLVDEIEGLVDHRRLSVRNGAAAGA